MTGVTGQVGGEFLPLLRPFGPVLAPTRAELDLTDTTAIRDLVRAIKPQWIVNTAAYTAVDKAESTAGLAYALNRDVPRVLGEEAARFGAAVMHFSTDYVFSGEGMIPWREDDPTGPLGVYGASKLSGERELRESGASHLIFRTSWVYGTHGSNFLKTILRLAGEREELGIVNDQHGAPTWSRSLARLGAHTVALFRKMQSTDGRTAAEAVQPLSGIYHACDAGLTTWFGFAQEILRLARIAQPQQRFATLKPVTTADYPTPARRPANSRMDCEKLSRVLDYNMPMWEKSTAFVMSELLGSAPDHDQLPSS